MIGVSLGFFRRILVLACIRKWVFYWSNWIYLYTWWCCCLCSENQHSDREPEHHRHVCVFLRTADGGCRGGWYSHVTWPSLWSVRLSRLAHQTPPVESSHHLDSSHSSHCMGAIRRRHLSDLVQGRNDWASWVSSFNFRFRSGVIVPRCQKLQMTATA